MTAFTSPSPEGSQHLIHGRTLGVIALKAAIVFVNSRPLFKSITFTCGHKLQRTSDLHRWATNRSFEEAGHDNARQPVEGVSQSLQIANSPDLKTEILNAVMSLVLVGQVALKQIVHSLDDLVQAFQVTFTCASDLCDASRASKVGPQ